MSGRNATRARRWRVPHEVLLRRVDAARAMLTACAMCELRCGTNRLAGADSPCRLGADSHIYKQYTSLNEERELLPAWRVFLGGCNFGCPHCDELPEATQTGVGDLVEPRHWAEELSQAVARGAKTLSLLGGEPSLHAHTILATAAASSEDLPLALNSNMYMTPEVLDLLDGVVHCYLADFKFGNDACAERLAGVPRYTEVVRRNLSWIFPRTAVIVRHVLLPGHGDCCFRPIADWLSRTLPGIRFQLYPGYVPCGEVGHDAGLGRLNIPAEVRAAREYLSRLDLQCEVAEEEQSTQPAHASRDGTGLAGLTIGANGRLYCHDVTPELSLVLSELCDAQGDPRDQPGVA